MQEKVDDSQLKTNIVYDNRFDIQTVNQKLSGPFGRS